MTGPEDVRPVGEVFDAQNHRIEVGVCGDAVSISFAGSMVLLPEDAAEEFGQMFAAACWEASAPAGAA